MQKKIALIFVVSTLVACSGYDPSGDIPLERQREYASALVNQKLYAQAVAEYTKLLERYRLDDGTRANINYTIGNIYFDQLGDYRNALTYYLKIKHVFRGSKLSGEVNKKIIACLERLGRAADAAATLKEATQLTGDEADSPFEHFTGDTVAVIAGRVLTTGEFDRLFTYHYTSLPPEQKAKAPTRDDKIAFLREYIKREVLYNSAKRQNIDQLRDVIEVAYLQKKNLMVEKLLDNEVYSKIKIEDSDVADYYTKNKDKLTETTEDGKKKQMSFEDAKTYISQLLYAQKAQSLINQLTDKLIQAQDARAFTDKIKE